MKEFMLFIKGTGNPVAQLSEERLGAHINKVGGYIGGLAEQKKLKSAQPLEPQGSTVSFVDGNFNEEPFDESQEAILGYYHLLAKDVNEAIAIAKADPRFEDGAWKIEVRPVMKVEGIN